MLVHLGKVDQADIGNACLADHTDEVKQAFTEQDADGRADS